MLHKAAEKLLVATGLIVLFSVLAAADTKPPAMDRKPGPIEITATPITSFTRGIASSEKRAGKVEFIGGLVLASPDEPNFGGWSGIAVDADEKSFVAVSDAGAWLTGTIAYDNGAPSGIRNARMGPILARDGLPLRRGRDRDAEAIAFVSGSVANGRVQIAYEQNARVISYPVTRDGIGRPDKTLSKPTNLTGMRRNNGFEAMTVIAGGPQKGQTVVIAERLLDLNRNHTGWLWTAGGIKKFSLTNIGDFDITDIASLSDGTVFILERRFRWLEGVKMRIRRLQPRDLQAGKLLEGETMLEASMDKEIDNMEGISATRRANGDVLLTLISDDNFNRVIQRSMLLQFRLPADTAK